MIQPLKFSNLHTVAVSPTGVKCVMFIHRNTEPPRTGIAVPSSESGPDGMLSFFFIS